MLHPFTVHNTAIYGSRNFYAMCFRLLGMSFPFMCHQWAEGFIVYLGQLQSDAVTCYHFYYISFIYIV